jgi:hypothetical protein
MRHAIGLAMYCLPLVAAMLAPYIDLLWPDFRPNARQFEVLVDFMLVASFFVLGGDEDERAATSHADPVAEVPQIVRPFPEPARHR